MGRESGYRTKQKEAIKTYLAEQKETHVTVNQIVAYFEKQEMAIGMTTVYRYLDRLVQDGVVKKYFLDGATAACYQYLDHEMEGSPHFHMKCESCGKLFHLECGFMEKIAAHLHQEHQFCIDSGKTVFYGLCKECSEKE